MVKRNPAEQHFTRDTNPYLIGQRADELEMMKPTSIDGGEHDPIVVSSPLLYEDVLAIGIDPHDKESGFIDTKLAMTRGDDSFTVSRLDGKPIQAALVSKNKNYADPQYVFKDPVDHITYTRGYPLWLPEGIQPDGSVPGIIRPVFLGTFMGKCVQVARKRQLDTTTAALRAASSADTATSAPAAK